MSSLLEALSKNMFSDLNKQADLNSASPSNFVNKLPVYVNQVVQNYFKYGIDLNTSIAEIAKKENLNEDQIQRIVEESNNQVYLRKYEELKKFPDREIIFDLADTKIVLKKINGEDTSDTEKTIEQQVKAASISGYSLEKIASEDTPSDNLNAFNYNAYEFANLSVAHKYTEEDLIKRELMQKIVNIVDQKEKLLQKTAADLFILAEALIKYDRMNVNLSALKSELIKQAEWTDYDFDLLQEAINNKISKLQEYKILPEDYQLDFVNTEIDKTAEEYSLGKYSKKTKPAVVVPIVATDQQAINQLNDFINIAKDIKQNKQKINKLVNTENQIKEKINKYTNIENQIKENNK